MTPITYVQYDKHRKKQNMTKMENAAKYVYHAGLLYNFTCFLFTLMDNSKMIYVQTRLD